MNGMARVIVEAISRVDLTSGEAGCQVILTAAEKPPPQVISQPENPGEIAASVIHGTMAALRGPSGQVKSVKIVLFLTMKEYADLGNPGINEEFEASFYSSAYTVAPPLEEIGSFIRLRKVERSSERRDPRDVSRT